MRGDKEWVAVGAGKANWVELAKEAGNSRRVGQKAVRGDSDRIKVTDHHLNFQELENVDGWTFEWGRQRKRSSLLRGEPKTTDAKLLRILRRQ